jgi:transglutaminase-like putative cysteine protease
MLQNDSLALRVDLIDRKTGKPYSTIDSLYLRGAVLETYHSEQSSEGNWTSMDPRTASPTSQLPLEEMRRSGWDGDEVRARITIEQNSSSALFSIPPYQRLATGPDVRHNSDRWLLSRRTTSEFGKFNRMTYQFATSAFRDARQSRYTPRWDDMVYPELEDQGVEKYDSNQFEPFDDRLDEAYRIMPGRTHPVRRISRYESDQYIRRCLEYDEYRVPSAWRLSEEIAKSAGPDRLQLANAIEQYLLGRGGYKYSLNQVSGEVPGLDPIEQFMSIHKQGNCQYFASAMVLMLRSQGIPARLVVGYSTDEYNSIGGFYVARQLHAHAWVEALIDTKWIPQDERYLSVVDSDPNTPPMDSHGYWVRFDPTPGGGGVEHDDGGRVSDVFQLAQNMWTDYVVDRNAAGGSRRDFTSGGSQAMISQYQSMFRWIDLKLSQIRAGQLGGGRLAFGQDFSWPAAIFGVILTLVIVGIMQVRMPKSWWRQRRQRAIAGVAAVPQVPFFAETIELLRRIGLQRSPSQTPLEFTDSASRSLIDEQTPSIDSPLRTLTDAFYDTRFSGKAVQIPALSEVTDEVAAALRAVRQRVELIEAGTQKHPNKQ